MSITLTPFGAASDGKTATLFTLKNASGASVSLCDFGARIVSIHVPDRGGKLDEVCLGFDSAAEYDRKGGWSVGATIGRVGNRIAGAAFTLNGVEYHLPVNKGTSCNHGGRGFHYHWWTAEPEEGAEADMVTFRYRSADGEEGFPGNMDVEVTYAWTQKNELCIRYRAVSDADTLCNLTNHAYFNLGGEHVRDHLLQLNAPLITEADAELVPTGRELDVSGLPVDLRRPMRIGDGLARAAEFRMLAEQGGYDFNFFIPGEGLRLFGALYCPATGRVMHVCSSEPCVQVFTGQSFNVTGHGGRHYGPQAGVALETQHHPDAIHHPNFPSVVLRAGEEFTSETVYAFGVE